jgi:1-aminocyclopropane-1-carboxylate deaminase/D-cysteine desulfhydrase-like pyridoxal-dependent ACC family enzyme
MNKISLFRQHTPIESYRVRGSEVFVKRDDLFARKPAPPLAKLRGLRLILGNAYKGGTRLVGCWDTRISKLGEGLAACCTQFPDLECIVSYPRKKNAAEPESIKAAAKLGATVYPVPGGRLTISFAKARTYVREQGGMMLPFGLECPETVDGVRREAVTIPRELLNNGTLVVCCGSGVTLAGLILGLPTLPRRIVGVSSGRSVRSIMACLNRYVAEIPPCLELREAQMPYSDALSFDCPFPSHPNYDLKAWKFLIDDIRNLGEPILFWNIGA